MAHVGGFLFGMIAGKLFELPARVEEQEVVRMSATMRSTPDTPNEDPVALSLDVAQAPYWSRSADELFLTLGSSLRGLSTTDAARRLKLVGPNVLRMHRKGSALVIFLNQFKSPLVLILIFAAVVSIFFQEWADAVIVLLIVLISSILSFYQEYSASATMEKLRRG